MAQLTELPVVCFEQVAGEQHVVLLVMVDDVAGSVPRSEPGSQVAERFKGAARSFRKLPGESGPGWLQQWSDAWIAASAFQKRQFVAVSEDGNAQFPRQKRGSPSVIGMPVRQKNALKRSSINQLYGAEYAAGHEGKAGIDQSQAFAAGDEPDVHLREKPESHLPDMR